MLHGEKESRRCFEQAKKIFSEKGVYNNVSLDMVFTINVKAEYEGSKLSAQRAEYSNSKNFLLLSFHGLMPSGCTIKFLKPTALGKFNAGKNLLAT